MLDHPPTGIGPMRRADRDHGGFGLARPITAIVYGEGEAVDAAIIRIAEHLIGRGARLAGLVQRNPDRVDRPRCDMTIDELWSGERFAISTDRGSGARGCRLDVAGLVAATELARAALATEPQLLIVNRFGKVEGEGGGARDLIAEAVEQAIPVLIAVPWRNLGSFRAFAEGLSIEHRFSELPIEAGALCRALGMRVQPPVFSRSAGWR